MHLLVEKSSRVPSLRMRWKQTLFSCAWLRTWIARRLSPICRPHPPSASQYSSQCASCRAMLNMIITYVSSAHLHVYQPYDVQTRAGVIARLRMS